MNNIIALILSFQLK